MATVIRPSIDDSIRAKARALKLADVSINHYQSRNDFPNDRGEWFVLSIRRTAASDWEVIGRRQTKAELVGLLEKFKTTANPAR